jgi:hypothetical protein
MNLNRTRSFQVQECRRLASYVIEGNRLYPDQEIAKMLGESPEFVAAVLDATSGHASSAIIEPGLDVASGPGHDGRPSDPAVVDSRHRARILTYDPAKRSVGICDPLGALTNMTYDPGSPRRADQDARPR